jgi:hypothetical protein
MSEAPSIYQSTQPFITHVNLPPMLRNNAHIEVLFVLLGTMCKRNLAHTFERSVLQESQEILKLRTLPLIPWLPAPIGRVHKRANLND